MPENYTLSLIAAMTGERVIGRGAKIPWRLKEDQKLFREITDGHPVIMGRLTWETLPKPLIGRRNIIISRTPETIRIKGPWSDRSAEAAGSLTEALELASDGIETSPAVRKYAASTIDGSEIFIIGGAQLYEAALPIADRLYISRVKGSYEGDIFFPSFSEEAWPLKESRDYEEFSLEIRERG